MGFKFSFLLLLAAGTLTMAAQNPKDAVAVDPVNHQVLLENEQVRIFEALVSPGTKSPMHTHPPFVATSLGNARLRMSAPDGSSTIFDLHPGQVLWMENAEHSWELLSGQLNVIGVEIKSAQRGVTPPPVRRPQTDIVAVDPTHHQVILENDHVRVFEVLGSPGARSPMHTHAPFVLISLSRTRAKMTGPDGSSSVLDVYPGQVLWMENVEHAWELHAGQLHVVGVEVKSAAGR